MKNTYRVFISSTYEDLKDERLAAMKAIVKAKCLPLGMELFEERSLSQWQIIEQNISESDFYILIVAGRYGSIDNETGISYTEREFNYAIKKKIPTLIYLKENIEDLSMDKIDNCEKIERFRKKLLNHQYVGKYNNSSDLEVKIQQSLIAEIKDRDDARTQEEYEYLADLIASLQNQINNLAEASIRNSLAFVDVSEKIRGLKKNNNLQ